MVLLVVVGLGFPLPYCLSPRGHSQFADATCTVALSSIFKQNKTKPSGLSHSWSLSRMDLPFGFISSPPSAAASPRLSRVHFCAFTAHMIRFGWYQGPQPSSHLPRAFCIISGLASSALSRCHRFNGSGQHTFIFLTVHNIRGLKVQLSFRMGSLPQISEEMHFAVLCSSQSLPALLGSQPRLLSSRPAP